MRQMNDAVHPVIRSAGAALLCTVLTRCLSPQGSELASELLCWLLMLFWVRRDRPQNEGIAGLIPTMIPANKAIRRSASSFMLWGFAFSIAAIRIFELNTGTSGHLAIFTPLLLIAQGSRDTETIDPEDSDAPFSFPIKDQFAISIVAVCSLLILSDWGLREVVLSLIPGVTALALYTILPRALNNTLVIPFTNVRDDINRLSMRVLAVLTSLLCFQILLSGFPTFNIIAAIPPALTKAVSWYYTIQLIRCTPWCVASLVATFGVLSTTNPFVQSSEAYAWWHILASLGTLSNIIFLIPKPTKGIWMLWIFCLLPIVPYVANWREIRVAASAAQGYSQSHTHPIESLVQQSWIQFELQLSRQSSTYSDAHAEYVHRYKMEPPLGFEAWFEYASLHQSPIIDDFDVINDRIAPFLRLSGQEVLNIMNTAASDPESELWQCTFSGSTGKTSCKHHHRTFDRHIQFLFHELLADVPDGLPDIQFVVNHLDEPRVLLPPPAVESPNAASRSEYAHTIISHRPIWDEITRFCPRTRAGIDVGASNENDTTEMLFIRDLSSEMNLCEHPEYREAHGMLLSPTSFRLIEGLVPVLSTGSLSTMGDVLIPSPAYIEKYFRYEASHDVEWDKKRNNLYWAGSTTGGFAKDGQWRNYHRQRFVELGQNLDRRKHKYLRDENGVVSLVESGFLNSRLFDVAFTNIFQCQEKYCIEQQEYFRAKSWADKDEALRSRLAFDLDGNGISGRYYKLLASKSLPLKQTLLHEWHDDRLKPWVHYIPVSQNLDEVPEMVLYLTSTTAGQNLAAEVAERGRHWAAKALRDIDLGIYLYRLLLELARIQHPDRPASVR